MDTAKYIVNALVEAGVEYAISIPETATRTICEELILSSNIVYVQPAHESDGVGIASGLLLTGRIAVVLMETSGLRAGFEIISRFQLSHSIHCIYIVANKGDLGERNWWAQPHYYTAEKIIGMLKFRSKLVNTLENFKVALRDSIASFLSGQVSPIIILDQRLLNN